MGSSEVRTLVILHAVSRGMQSARLSGLQEACGGEGEGGGEQAVVISCAYSCGGQCVLVSLSSDVS